MFTGIVEGQAAILRIESAGTRVELEVDVGNELAQGVGVGDSIALSGCCLTVVRIAGPHLAFEAILETLQRTTLGARRVGDRLNVERALRADGRLGGHLVQGHVDGTGVVEELRHAGDDVRMQIGCSKDLARLVVPKGSITLEGVSLTVVDSADSGFSVALIPQDLTSKCPLKFR